MYFIVAYSKSAGAESQVLLLQSLRQGQVFVEVYLKCFFMLAKMSLLKSAMIHDHRIINQESNAKKDEM